VVAPAAPAAAAGSGLVLGLWILCLIIVLIGLRAGWDHTIGALLRGLGNAANVGGWKIKVGAGGAFFKLDDVVQDSIGKAILANEQALGLWWHGMKAVVEYTADSIVDFGAAVHDTIDGLVHGTIPQTVAGTVAPVRDRVDRGNAAARARDRAEAQARSRGIDAVGRDLTAEKLARERGIDNVGARAKGYTDAAVGRVQGAIAAERAYSHRVLGGRLSRLEKLLGVGVIGGIALATLTRVFPYWQCSNVRRFLRSVCRMPTNLLDDLFGLAVLLIGPVSIVEFAELLQSGADEIADGIHYFVHE